MTMGVAGAAVEVLGRGWFRIPGAIEPSICRSMQRPAEAPWRELAPQVGQVRMSGWYHQPADSELSADVRQLSKDLTEPLQHEFGDHSAIPEFNEISWQRHVSAERAVDVHRDQTVYIGVIAVLTLVGTAQFRVFDGRAGSVVDSWRTLPGDLVLLRGAGLGHPNARCPWHSVAAPTVGERQTLTLRHSTRGAGWWE